MIRVNLLPFRAARKKDNVRRQASIYFFALIVCVSALVFVNMKLGNKTDQLKNRISDTERELKTYQAINKEIDEIKRKLKVLTTKTNVIKDLQANRGEPVLMLDSMTEIIVPNRMWFNSLMLNEKIQNTGGANTNDAAAKQPTKVVDIAVTGIALDNKTVADFMTRLEESKLYNNVNLQTLKQVNIRKVNLKEFVITFNRISAPKDT
jgi:type IV pilus assembly protein PilN